MRQYARMAENTLTVTDNRTGETFEVEITDGTVKAMDFRQMKDERGRLRPHDLRPGLHEHRVVPERDHLHRRRGRRARAPRHPDRGAVRELELPRGRLPAGARRAADQGRARLLGAHDRPPHLRAREHQELDGGVPLRRPPDVDAALHGRRALHLLPGGQGPGEREREVHGDRPADREDAHARGLRVPPPARAALRLPGQRPLVHGQLPLDALQDDRGEVRARPAARARPRRAVDPARRPRAELLDGGGARGRLVAGGPLLGRRPPASPRSTGRCTAAPTRPC